MKLSRTAPPQVADGRSDMLPTNAEPELRTDAYSTAQASVLATTSVNVMSHPHWQYFLSIEADLLRCSSYVEFTSNNFGTYSVAFARIIVAAAAEFDAVAKSLCKALDPTQSPDRITGYRPIIVGRYPQFLDYTIHVPRAKLSLQPWKTWTPCAAPRWWKGYNKIKHERDVHFHEANLKNALDATAGLLAGIAYLYDATLGAVPEMDLGAAPQLFEPQDEPAAMQDPAIRWSCKVWK